MRRKWILIAALFSLWCTHATPAQDRVSERIEAAEKAFEQAVERTKDKLAAALDQEVRKARGAGSLERLVELQEQKRLYEDEGVMPNHPAMSRHAKSYNQSLRREGDRLVRVYEYAVQEYTKEDKVDVAQEILERIHWIKPTTAVIPELGIGQNQTLTAREAIGLFELPESAVFDEDTIQLRAGNIDRGQGFFRTKAFTSDDVEFAFSIKASAYQVIGAEINGERYFYSRGHWQNGGTCISAAGQVKNLKKKQFRVRDGSRFTPMALRIQDEKLTWFYDGQEAFECKIQAEDPPYQVRLFTGSHDRQFFLRDIRVESGYEITRTTLKGAASPGIDGDPEVESLKAATLKHNKLIVAEREQLQQAILEAEQEHAISDARAAYKREVTSIKKRYIDELNVVLGRTLTNDRLAVAGKIKEQILRVRSQIEQLNKQETPPDVPEIDTGQEGDAPAEPQPSDSDSSQSEDGPADSPRGDGKTDFFGLPLE